MASVVEQLVSLRLWVGLVGEERRWWPSALADRFPQLERQLFPRTGGRAAVEILSAVACRAHDTRVSRRAFHLFRLPDPWEERIADALASRPSESLAQVSEARQWLGERTRPRPGSAAGPLDLGPQRSREMGVAGTLAVAAYLAADRDDVIVYPYFTI